MPLSERVAVYPGTFDPVTYGHLDIITKASSIFDRLIIAVADNGAKTPTFSMTERVQMIKAELARLGFTERVSVESFSGLLVDFVQAKSAKLIVRGLRAVSDFEYEFQMACVNTKLCGDIQTIFIPADEKTHFISSRLVKEVARLGGDISEFASEEVAAKLRTVLNKKS